MKIPFLNWTEEQNFSDEAKSLFNESGECYKASAYRAALLFSFLGFQTVLKDRILESRTPKNYQSGEWSQLQNTLLEDDSWDATVIKIVNNKKKPIFSLNDDLINQYMYWKNRRNDCAHAKGNEIGDAHVEAYWLFLKSNSMKFRVNGSKEYILEQIKEFYDPNITAPNASINPLVSQIPHSIDRKDLQIFFQDLKDITADKNFNDFTLLDSNKSSVWFALLDLDYYPKEIIKFLILDENDSYAIELIDLNPNYVKNFQGESSFIRSMWNKFCSANDYRILLNLIKNNLIPPEELDECYTHMFNNVDSDLFSKKSNWEPFNELELEILKGTNFFNLFYTQAFKENRISGDFNWGNRNRYLVTKYIEEFQMDYDIALAIKNCEHKNYPPRYLNRWINDFFKQHSEIEDKYKELLLSGIPEELNIFE
ncbi:MAG: hypothetical protein KZY73_03195 [Bacillaceae bacterium]|uniref:hypothetical protein n=1 Tax=Bacillus safensis TaxID=561879 RepID=UPI001D196647|nr:hypothetical protein [Bacillus safensis]MBW4850932.1 hypothetical protein [Bacillaceae bacterium]MBW4851777.1 hypothetical protein [Bacillaceae bacterium]MBW4855920.1 hypothetical protein [Bacillaceae bacterium]